jgi:predicted ATPase
VQTLGQWLADPSVRLITLTGPGGVGKTRLALEVVDAIAAEGATRVVFVALAATRHPAFVAPAIAEAFGLADITPLNLPKRLRVVCADQPTMLVLDNFEQILDAAPLVAELLTSVALLRLLVTSRAPLHVCGGSGSTPSDRSRWRWTRMPCRPPIQKLRRRLQAAIGVAREEGKSSPRDERYRLTIAFYPIETAGADATRPPPAKKRTAKKRGAR